MSTHPSLKSDKWKLTRNVKKRWERIAKLNRNKKWVEGMSIYGLPKEKIERIKFKIEKEKMSEEDKNKLLLEASLNVKEKTKKKSKDVTGIR